VGNREEQGITRDSLGQPITTFAYPFGQKEHYTPETAEIIKDAGFIGACANFKGLMLSDTDRFAIPRLQMHEYERIRVRSSDRSMVGVTRSRLSAGSRPWFIVHRKDWILPFVQGKKALDLGCVEHTAAKSSDPDWLHGLIAQGATSVLGVDILERDIAVLKAEGQHVVCANVETMDLGDTFEVAIAGDLIEHLSNPNLFMDRVRVHLKPGGLLLITTPNAVTFMRFMELLVTGRVAANPGTHMLVHVAGVGRSGAAKRFSCPPCGLRG
jgi:2-polyprenyl-3-methyl-5-hydroxy-6-metoxy-1,4-benzoquinol methylase